MMRWTLSLGALLLVGAACGGGDGYGKPGATPGEPAVWDVDAAHRPGASDTSFTALVERLGCASGQTGQVLTPVVAERADDVVVTFTVKALGPGAYACPSNTLVPYRVTLADPLAGRHLVDGSCLAGAAAATSFCVDGGQRWPVTAI